MKKVIWVIGFVLLTTTVEAQTKKASTKKKQQSNTQKAVTNKTTTSKKEQSTMPYAITLSSTGSYNALASNNTNNRLQIWDPTVKALDARAKGANISLGKSGIVGMPKRAYGFANGQIMLRSSDAVSSGSTTGSGSVGTGTSAGAMGRMAQSVGVNGKNPYAGTSMWGTNATLIGTNGRDASSRATVLVDDDK